MRRWLRHWWTAHRLRIMLQYGWCPRCLSSPPLPECQVCFGHRDYGRHKVEAIDLADWAERYVWLRENEL